MDTAIMMPNRIGSGTQSLWNGGPLTATELGLCFCSGRSRGTFEQREEQVFIASAKPLHPSTCSKVNNDGLDKELKLRTIFAIQRLNGLALEICGLIFVLDRILLFFSFWDHPLHLCKRKVFLLMYTVDSRSNGSAYNKNLSLTTSLFVPTQFFLLSLYSSYNNI